MGCGSSSRRRQDYAPTTQVDGKDATPLKEESETEAPLSDERSCSSRAVPDTKSAYDAPAVASKAAVREWLHVGSKFDTHEERYTIESELGDSGFGVMFNISDAQGSEFTARILPRECRQAEMLAVEILAITLIRQEARRHATNFVNCFAPKLHLVGGTEDGKWLVLIMERMVGTLDGNHQLISSELRRSAWALARTLGCLHRVGLVHADINPSSVLISSESGFPMLVNYGYGMALSAWSGLQALGPDDGTRILALTLEFAAPELRRQYKGGHRLVATPRSNMWSWATTMQSLVGSPHVQSRLGLGRVFSDCAEEDPKDRPVCFQEVAGGLEDDSVLDWAQWPQGRRTPTQREQEGGQEAQLVCEAFNLFLDLQAPDKQDNGAVRPDIAVTLATFGAACHFLGEYDKAEEATRRSLHMFQQLHGEEHPLTLNSKSNLASTLHKSGNCAGAEQLLREVTEAREHKFGSTDDCTLTSKSNLAVLLHDSGDFPRARQLKREVLDALLLKLSAEHPRTLRAKSSLARSLLGCAALAEAEQLQREVVAVLERMLGAKHSDTLHEKNNLATTLLSRGDFRGAEQLKREVLEACSPVQTARRPRPLVGPDEELSVTFRSLADMEVAERHLREALELGGTQVVENAPDARADSALQCTQKLSDTDCNIADLLAQTVVVDPPRAQKHECASANETLHSDSDRQFLSDVLRSG